MRIVGLVVGVSGAVLLDRPSIHSGLSFDTGFALSFDKHGTWLRM